MDASTGKRMPTGKSLWKSRECAGAEFSRAPFEELQVKEIEIVF
jgi:hypothetical protein